MIQIQTDQGVQKQETDSQPPRFRSFGRWGL
jgi:hypothetical protein